MNSTPFNIVIADKQFLVTVSLETLIQNSTCYNVLGVAESITELKKLLKANTTDLLIADSVLFNYEGLDTLKLIKKEFPKLKVLIITNNINKIDLTELTRAGIKNIILKSTDKEEFFQAVDAALKNKKFFCDEVLELMMNSQDKNFFIPAVKLTASETEIIKLIAGGLTTKEIAAKRNVSFHTVMSHRKNIFRKLKINNTSALLMYAMHSGIISDNIEYYI